MAEKIKKEVDQDVELIRSGGGVFEIYDGSDQIYSKRDTGSFPDDGNIIKSIRSRI